MLYKDIERWKAYGLIDDKQSIDEQMELAKNLTLGETLTHCKMILNFGSADFYKDVRLLLYPIIIHYTLIKKENFINPIIYKFINYCDENLRVKFNLEKYNDDYLLCKSFIATN